MWYLYLYLQNGGMKTLEKFSNSVNFMESVGSRFGPLSKGPALSTWRRLGLDCCSRLTEAPGTWILEPMKEGTKRTL